MNATRRGSNDVAALIVGGAVGAALRFEALALWRTPIAIVFVTVVSILVGFGLLGYALASRTGGVIRAFLAGVAGAIASITGYIAIGVSESPWAVGAVLILAPAAVIAGLGLGATAGVALHSRSRELVGGREK